MMCADQGNKMRSKSFLLTTTAAFVITASAHAADVADDIVQTPETPGQSTQIAPQPTIHEEIVYLRDVMAVQTLRLDEAEQGIARQSRLIQLQDARIAQLEVQLQTTQIAADSANRALAELRRNGAPISAPATYADGGAVENYLVRSGDTLFEIASEKNTTVQTLARINKLKSPYRLNIGQQLQVPTGRPVALAQAPASDQAPLTPPQSEDVEKAKTEKVPGETVRTAANDDDNQRDDDRRDDDRRDGSQRVAAVTERRPDDKADGSALPEEVGQRPEEDDEQPPYVALFSDLGGILTPKGTFYVEPAVTFTTSSDNRFFFNGTEILDAILIGAIEATDSDRLALTQSIGFRYGLTNKIEIDAKIPYVYREDRVSGVAIDGSATNPSQTFIDDVYGAGLGDIEFGAHYQLNEGRKLPYVIANIRAKAPTGTGPFDVERTPGGIETQLATGSGFWSVEPSFTFILPTDPAIIFANIGYQINLPTSPNQQIGDSIIQQFNAGDAIKTSFGIGLSLNERLSMNLGYSQSYILGTKSTFQDTVANPANGNFDTRVLTQPAATVGAFALGGSYAVTDRVSINLNSSFGATDEAPDMTVSLRANIRLFD